MLLLGFALSFNLLTTFNGSQERRRRLQLGMQAFARHCIVNTIVVVGNNYNYNYNDITTVANAFSMATRHSPLVHLFSLFPSFFFFFFAFLVLLSIHSFIHSFPSSSSIYAAATTWKYFAF